MRVVRMLELLSIDQTLQPKIMEYLRVEIVEVDKMPRTAISELVSTLNRALRVAADRRPVAAGSEKGLEV